LPDVRKLAATAAAKSDAKYIHAVNGFTPRLFYTFLEANNIDEYSFTRKCLGSTTRSWIRRIVGEENDCCSLAAEAPGSD
jgi:hypothetical protein